MLRKVILTFTIIILLHSSVSAQGSSFIYKIKEGDTLYSISKRFCLKVEDIKRWNHLKGNRIRVGQALVLKVYGVSNFKEYPRDKEPGENEDLKDRDPAPEKSNNSQTLDDIRRQIVELALSLNGIPYKRGGISFDGLDCSGLVVLVFKTSGIEVPRTAKEQFLKGKPVEMERLMPGDLVFFFTSRGALPHHVGVYIGDNLFVHASRSLKRVIVSSLDQSYFIKRFAGVRRFISEDSEY